MEIEDLFKKHEVTIATRKERLARYWEGEDIGRPPIFFVNWNLCPRQILDDECLLLEKAVQHAARILELPGDSIPIFWPDNGAPTTASAFGGDIVREAGNSRIWIKPILSSLDEVWNMESPEPISGLVKVEFDMCRRFFEMSGGVAPISPPDSQGPINIASLLIDQTELLIGMYEKPDAVRRLLRICTDLFIGICDAYEREFGDAFSPFNWPMIWMPKGKGGTLTQDSIPTLSPEFYRDFELPFVQEISDRFGGVFIHCCGSLEHALEEVGKIRNLKGVDHAYRSSNAEKILEILGTGVTLSSHVAACSEWEFPSYDKYLEYLLRKLPEGARVWHVLQDDKPESAARSLELLGLNDMREEYERRRPDDSMAGMH